MHVMKIFGYFEIWLGLCLDNLKYFIKSSQTTFAFSPSLRKQVLLNRVLSRIRLSEKRFLKCLSYPITSRLPKPYNKHVQEPRTGVLFVGKTYQRGYGSSIATKIDMYALEILRDLPVKPFKHPMMVNPKHVIVSDLSLLTYMTGLNLTLYSIFQKKKYSLVF